MRIAVGLSGVVDSAVTAALLKEQGHEVIGVFMKNWSDDFGLKGDCPWEQDQRDAESVAKHLGIGFLSYNFERQYRERVIQYFFDEYRAGRTPNPDILCNSEIKFNLFLKKCLQELNVDKIATGHYARMQTGDFKLETSNKNHGNNISSYFFQEILAVTLPTHRLLKGVDLNKDQSYFLCRLTQNELAASLFPLGEYTKPEVRELARKFNLPVAAKKDSQGICFVGKINVREFIKSELGAKEGNIVDLDSGRILGKHEGLWFYTIGQREGLGLGGGPWFVVKKELETNTVFVAKGMNNPALFQREVVLEDMQFLNYELFMNNLENMEIMLRYRQKPQKARVKTGNFKLETLNISKGSDLNSPPFQGGVDTAGGRVVFFSKYQPITLLFDQPQRAVAPGQFGCVYVGEEIVASGVIQ